MSANPYERAGRPADAERILLQAAATQPTDGRVLLQLASLYAKQGDFDNAIETLRQRVAIDPGNPEPANTVATFYWDRAYRGRELSVAQKRSFIGAGLTYVDQALLLKPAYFEALTYKNLLLRLQASVSDDPQIQRSLLEQADTIRNQAIRLKTEREAWAAIPPNAVRIGGDIRPPAKVKDVRPINPEEALKAGVTGVVILEVVIAEDGGVLASRVVRSLPLLDSAALAAVNQWEFTPTVVDGVAVPIVMTVTVNFMSEGMAVLGGPPPPPPPPPSFPVGDSPGRDATAAGRGGGDRPDDPGYPPDAVRVGGGLSPPRRVVYVRPVYPDAAREAKAQGDVVVDVLVGTDGRVVMARVLRSIPIFDQAAVDAVRQWEFVPTVLNGRLVPVITTVTVDFLLR